MKARIEKKLSKRLVEVAPYLFRDAWQDSEISELARNQCTRVANVWCVGGDVDYWGECIDSHTALAEWQDHAKWSGQFPSHTAGHEYQYMPDTGNYRFTGKNLIELAKAANEKAKRIAEEGEARRREVLKRRSEATK